MSFYCKIGDVETTTSWLRPNLETLKEWYLEWRQLPGLTNYTSYVVGNFAESQWGNSNIPTWDCDIVLTGDIINKSELKYIMDEAVRVGFEKQILIDIWHNDNLIDFEVFRPILQTRAFKTFYKDHDGEVYTHVMNHFEPIEDGLYQSNIQTASKSIIKAMDRFKDGSYAGIQKPLEEILG